MKPTSLDQLVDQIISAIQPTPAYKDSFRLDGEDLFFMGGQGEKKVLYMIGLQPAF